MSPVRTRLAFLGALALIAALVWGLRLGGESAGPEEATLDDGRSGNASRKSDELWVEAEGVEEGASDSHSSERRTAGGPETVRRASEGLLDSAEEQEDERVPGVLVRVVDGSGQPLSGIPVAMRWIDPTFESLRATSSMCDPGKSGMQCVSCHAPPEQPRPELSDAEELLRELERTALDAERRQRIAAEDLSLERVLSAEDLGFERVLSGEEILRSGMRLNIEFPGLRRSWSPPILGRVVGPHSAVTRGTTTAEGTVFLAADPARSGRHHVLLDLPVGAPVEREVEPALEPLPEVELVLADPRRVRVEVGTDDSPIGDGRWSVHWTGYQFGPVASVWERYVQKYELGSGESLELFRAGSSQARVEAWIGGAFAPRVHLEPDSPADPGAPELLVLEWKRWYALAKVRVLDVAGEPLRSTPLAADLFENARSRRIVLNTDEEGVLRFYLDAVGELAGGRHLKLKRGFDGRLREVGADEAWIDLSSYLRAGEEHALPDARLGEGPLLIQGRAVESGGAPVPGVIIHCEQLSEQWMCDESGAFMRTGFPRDASLTLWGKSEEWVPAKRIEVQPMTRGVEVPVYRAGKLSGRVSAPKELLESGMLEVRFVPKNDPGGDSAKTYGVANDGSFVMKGLVHGPARLSFTAGLAYGGMDVEVDSTPQDLGVFDIGKDLQRVHLRPRLANGERWGGTFVVAGYTSKEKAFEFAQQADAQGDLVFFVGPAIESWVLLAGGSVHRGSCDVPGVIELEIHP